MSLPAQSPPCTDEAKIRAVWERWRNYTLQAMVERYASCLVIENETFYFERAKVDGRSAVACNGVILAVKGTK